VQVDEIVIPRSYRPC